MSGEVEEQGVEADGIAVPLQHDALQIVVPEFTGTPLPRLEGFDMAAQEVVHPAIEVEAQEEAPGVAEHHHEGHQRALCTPDRHLAEVAPVDLGLFAGKGGKAQIGLGHGPGTLGRDHGAEVALASPVAACDGHLVEPGGGQSGPGHQGLPDEGQERGDLRGPASVRIPGHPGLGDDTADRVVMDAELACDGADLPRLGTVKAQDLGAGLLVDGHRHSLRAGRKPG